MDGFEAAEGVIVIAATNYAESLDIALTRPGRFDRHVAVPLPDIRGRHDILQHYLKACRPAAPIRSRNPLSLMRGVGLVEHVLGLHGYWKVAGCRWQRLFVLLVCGVSACRQGCWAGRSPRAGALCAAQNLAPDRVGRGAAGASHL